jgi:hypothetical protein
VWISLLAALTLAAAPATSPQTPITVLVAPPDAAGAPAHVIEFAQEHVSEQLKSRGLEVIRIEDVTRKMSPSKRRALLRCNRTAAACIKSLGTVGKAEVVLVTELSKLRSGYRAGARMYAGREGRLITENLIPGVREDRLLDALTQALDAVVPRTQTELRGAQGTPSPKVGLEMPPPPDTTTTQTPPVVERTQPTVTPGTTTPPKVEPAPTQVATPGPAPRDYPLRGWSWLPTAGGAALVGVGVVFQLQASDKYNQLDSGTDRIENSGELVSSGKRAVTLRNVAFGLGAAAIGAGVVMYLLPGDAPPQVQPSAAVVPGGGMVGLSGTWP